MQACAMEGTHYADLSGDSFFQRDVIDQHHATARRLGFGLLLMLGLENMPQAMFMQLATQR